MKLTKYEEFVVYADAAGKSFYTVATELNRSFDSVARAYKRGMKKLTAYSRAMAITDTLSA